MIDAGRPSGASAAMAHKQLKRRGVLGRYAAEIDEMYAGGGVMVEAAREGVPAT